MHESYAYFSVQYSLMVVVENLDFPKKHKLMIEFNERKWGQHNAKFMLNKVTQRHRNTCYSFNLKFGPKL